MFGILGGGSGTNIDDQRYLPMYDASLCDQNHESQCWTPLPLDGTVSKLYVSIALAPTQANQGWRVTVRKNGTDTGLFCDLVGTGAVTCQDTSDTVTFSAGDRFDVGISVTPGFQKPSGSALRYTAFYGN